MKGKVTPWILKSLGFFALLAVLGAGLSNATPRDCVGKFTLASATQWGTVNLPAGDYSFELDVTNDLIVIRGQKRNVAIMSLEHHEASHLESSALVLVSRAHRKVVSTLELRAQGLIFTYPVPRDVREEVAKGPMTIEHVPVAENTK